MEHEDSFSDLTYKQHQYKTIFDSVTLPYIISTFQSIVDFIQDTTSLNILIREQTSNEVQFLSVLPHFVTKETRYSLLPHAAQAWGKEIAKLMKQYSVTLRVVVRRGNAGRHRLKDVEIFKQMATSRGSNKKKKTEDIYNIVTKKVEDYDPRQMFLLSLARNNVGAAPTPAGTNPARSQNWRLNMDNNESATSTEIKPKPNDSVSGSGSGSGNRTSNSNYSLKASGIKWQAAGTTEEQVADNNLPLRNNDRRGGRRTLGAKHSKLLEALAKPLDCVPATRMMQKMGWTGGALGARGEGITEPIMPALDIVQGAGFGHSQPKGANRREQRQAAPTKKSCSRTSSSTPSEFRILVLENLLNLLRGDDCEKDFQIRGTATRKEVRFINTALKSLNARKNLGLNSNEEKELIAKIKDIYASNDRFHVDVEYANNYNTVTLIKTEREQVKKSSRASRRARRRVNDEHERDESSGSSSDEESASDALVFYSKRDLERLMDDLSTAEPALSHRRLITLSSRVAVFKAILTFVKSNRDFGIIAFEKSKISRKVQKFLRTCIDNINFCAKASYSSWTENDLYRDILRYKKSLLRAEVLSGRQFTLENEGHRRPQKSQTGQTNTETSKTDELISDKLKSKANLDKTKDKTKDNLDSDSDRSVISLKDYEVYDINLEDTSTDESDSEKSQHGAVNRPWYSEKECLAENNEILAEKNALPAVKNDISAENNELTPKDGDENLNKENGLDKDSLINVISLKTKYNSDFTNVKDLYDHIDVISKDVSKIDCSDFNNRAKTDSCDLTAKNNGINNNEKDTEKLLSLCKVNNLNDILNDDSAKVSVSIDIKMELNTNSFQKYTKEELIEKIKNSSDLNIDFGITNDLPNTSKRTSDNFDETQSNASKKSKLNYTVAEITFSNNAYVDEHVVEKIEEEIFSKIDENNLPKLKFLSYDEDKIQYRCDSDSSFDWLKNVIENLLVYDKKLNITLSNELKKSRYKMKAVLKCFSKINSTELLKKIGLYNPNVKVDNWLLLDVKYEKHCIIYIFDIDFESYMCICDCNFSLYSGINIIEFSIFNE